MLADLAAAAVAIFLVLVWVGLCLLPLFVVWGLWQRRKTPRSPPLDPDPTQRHAP